MELFENSQDQLIRIITEGTTIRSIGCALRMGIDTGYGTGITIEEDGIAFIDGAGIDLVLNRHNLQREADDGVTTVDCGEGIVVRTLFGEFVISELIEVAFTDRSYNRFRSELNRQDGYLKTDSRLLSFGVDYGIPIDTGLIDGHGLGRIARQCPLIGQVVCADGD